MTFYDHHHVKRDWFNIRQRNFYAIGKIRVVLFKSDHFHDKITFFSNYSSNVEIKNKENIVNKIILFFQLVHPVYQRIVEIFSHIFGWTHFSLQFLTPILGKKNSPLIVFILLRSVMFPHTSFQFNNICFLKNYDLVVIYKKVKNFGSILSNFHKLTHKQNPQKTPQK